MSTAAASAAVLVAPPDPVAVYRDDGRLAAALGRVVGPVVRVPAPLLALAGPVPLAVAAAIGGDVPLGVAGAVLAWLLVAVGASSGRPRRERTRWAEPPLVRLAEYAGITWIAALEGPSAYPAAFALLAALTFRHYDLVYRLRHRGVTPAAWLTALSGGWDGRLVVAYALLVAGALPAGLYVLAAILGAAFVGEAVVGWVVHGRVQRPLEYEDAEDEGQ
jgi:hypothetical protein